MKALENKIPPVLLTILFGLLMYLVSRFTPGFSMHGGLKLAIFMILVLTGATVGLAGVMAFRQANTTVNPLTPEASSSLVDRGVFKFTRNPMYLALLFALAAWAMFLGNMYSLALTMLFVAYMNRFQIQPEERALETLFGKAYIDYRHRVRRWI